MYFMDQKQSLWQKIFPFACIVFGNVIYALSIKLLEEAFDQNDYVTVQKVSHKILPLIKMIGDNEVITIVDQLEKGKQLSKEIETNIIVELDRYIAEAKVLKDTIETKINEYN